MTKLSLIPLLALTLLVSATGCGSGRPDPTKNPDFNHEAEANPGSIQMGPATPKGAPKSR